MDKKNRYCKGYTAWLAHASIGPRSNSDDWMVISPEDKNGNVVVQNVKTGQTITVGKSDPWYDIFTPRDQKTNKTPALKGSGDPVGSTHTNRARSSTSKDHGIGYLDENTGTAWRGGSGTIGNVSMPQGDNDKIMKDIQTARNSTSGTSKQTSDNNKIMNAISTARSTYNPDIRKTSGRKRVVTNDSYYPMSDGSLSKGDLSKPSSWDPKSSSYRDWKKKYNQSYYQSHKDYWRKYYGVKNPIAPSSATSNMYRDEAYKQAAEARSRAQYDRTNYDRRSNAQKMLDRSARDTSPSRPTFSGELFNAKTRLNDLWSSGASSIANAGKSVINKAKANRSSFNDMWSNGASAIASAGKSFLDAWKSGLGK